MAYLSATNIPDEVNTLNTRDRARPPFVYRPLDMTTNSFRLMKLMPSRVDGFLQAKLWHSELLTEYRCLSYVWGDQSKTFEILLNGSTFHVGENLYYFLEDLNTWTLDEPFSLWIDAICIDQSNDQERGHQVQRMDLIYSGAREVLVWLDNGDFLDDIVLEWLSSADEKSYPEEDAPPQAEEQLKKICRLPYWRRAWITQEILLAKHIRILLPGIQINWMDLCSAVQLFGTRKWSKPAHILLILWVARHKRLFPTISSTRPGDLMGTSITQGDFEDNLYDFWELLLARKASSCKDERDIIYSLIGLLKGNKDFAVNYKEDVVGLFWRAGHHFDAWINVSRIYMLAKALGLHKSPLKNSLGNGQDNLRLHLPVRHAYSATSRVSHFLRKMRCKFKHNDQFCPIRCARNAILLCTDPLPETGEWHPYVHGWLHQIDHLFGDSFRVSLAVASGSEPSFWKFPSCDLETFDVPTKQWVKVTKWCYVRKHLKIKDFSNGDRWRLSVPPTYVTALVSNM